MDFGLENQESSWKSCGWNMCCFRVCFFTALEWILGGFGEVLSILGGCQEGTKTGPKANSSRNFIFWPCWSVLGGILKGFWECFGRVLEGFGWVFGVSGGILDTWGPLSGVFHFWAAFYWVLLCWLALGCILVYFPIVSLLSAAFDCFCWFWQLFAAWANSCMLTQL